jgi:hypothetical protein
VKRAVTILDAVNDEHLFAPWFKDRATWAAWCAFLSALFALPMSDEQFETYRRCTGRTTAPSSPASEGWLVCGRRAGKSFILALIAVYLACFRDYRQYLAPGERGTVAVVAVDRRQSRVIMRYVKALLAGVPMLARLIEGETAESVDLSNGVSIEVHTSSYKTTRGYTAIAVLLDELAFFATDDAAEPDREIIAALRPSMATIPGAVLLCASSPYARRGALWDAYRKHHGKDGDPVLVWQAETRVMNPTVPLRVIEEATERDPASAAAEYGAQFRSDIEGFVTLEVVEACVGDHAEMAPLSALSYFGFVDPSGGSADSFTLAISHADGERAVIDLVREITPRFSPAAVIEEYSNTLKTYRITSVTGDRYAGEFPRELFRKHGIQYQCSEKPKSDLFRDLLPLLNSGRVVLPKSDRLVAQLCGLERRTARSGKDSIDHGPGGHDDVANAVAGAAAVAINKSTYLTDYRWLNEDTDVPAVEVPSLPKRRHPNLTDEQLDRISQPVALCPGGRLA